MIVEFKIDSEIDREKFIVALINNGYTVKIRKDKDYLYSTSYYVQVLDFKEKEVD